MSSNQSLHFVTQGKGADCVEFAWIVLVIFWERRKREAGKGIMLE